MFSKKKTPLTLPGTLPGIWSTRSIKAARVHAPEVQMLVGSNKAIALGLKWQAIVTRDKNAAQKIAAAAKASHSVSTPDSVGFGVFNGDAKKEADKLQTHAGALMLSQKSPNAESAHFFLSYGQDHVWHVQLQKGRPISDSVITLAAAHTQIQQLTTGHDLFTDLSGIGGLAPPGHEYFSCADLLKLPSPANTLVLKVPSQYFWMRIPAPLRTIGAVAVLGGVAWFAYAEYKSGIDRKIASAQKAAMQQADDAAVSLFASKRSDLYKSMRPDVDIKPLRSRIDALPLTVAGWMLERAVCTAKQAEPGVIASSKAWACSAQYTIGDVQTSFVTYDKLGPLVPSWAALRMLPARKFLLEFEAVTEVISLTEQSIKSVDQQNTGAIAKLQKHLPDLPMLQDIKFEQLKFDAPKKSDGTVLAMTGAKLPLKATVAVSAPLLKMDKVLADLPPDVAWQVLTVSAAKGTKANGPIEITAAWSGEIYAQ